MSSIMKERKTNGLFTSVEDFVLRFNFTKVKFMPLSSITLKPMAEEKSMKETLRIAIGGLQHETNTFSPIRTRYENFRIIRRGEKFETGLGIQLFYENVELFPTFVAAARPSGLVCKAAYLQLKEQLRLDMAEAMRAGDNEKRDTLRGLPAPIWRAET